MAQISTATTRLIEATSAAAIIETSPGAKLPIASPASMARVSHFSNKPIFRHPSASTGDFFNQGLAQLRASAAAILQEKGEHAAQAIHVREIAD